MSNRAKWSHRNRVKPGPNRARIPASLAIFALGSFLVFAALEGMRTHIWMFPTFDFRFGTPATGQTIGLLILGTALIVAGIAGLVVRN